MKWLPVCALIWPLSVAAEGFVEAVSVEQLPGLENTYPAWSPDGQFIVYASEQDGNLDIFRMRVDGSEKQYLTRHPATDVQRVTDLPDWDTYRRSRRTATNSFGGASHRPAASPNPVAIRRSSG
jgi:Tol biopolymer transport system component